MLEAGNPGKSRDVCDHPALFLTNNHAILKCLLASYSTVKISASDSVFIETMHTLIFNSFNVKNFNSGLSYDITVI